MASFVEGFIAVAVLGIAALLATVAIASWRRVGGSKLAFLAGAFALFALKGALLLLGLADVTIPFESWSIAIDLGALLLLYFGTLG